MSCGLSLSDDWTEDTEDESELDCSDFPAVLDGRASFGSDSIPVLGADNSTSL